MLTVDRNMFTFVVYGIYSIWKTRAPSTLTGDITSSNVTLHSGLQLSVTGSVVTIRGTITDSTIEYPLIISFIL